MRLCAASKRYPAERMRAAQTQAWAEDRGETVICGAPRRISSAPSELCWAVAARFDRSTRIASGTAEIRDERVPVLSERIHDAGRSTRVDGDEQCEVDALASELGKNIRRSGAVQRDGPTDLIVFILGEASESGGRCRWVRRGCAPHVNAPRITAQQRKNVRRDADILRCSQSIFR